MLANVCNLANASKTDLFLSFNKYKVFPVKRHKLRFRNTRNSFRMVIMNRSLTLRVNVNMQPKKKKYWVTANYGKRGKNLSDFLMQTNSVIPKASLGGAWHRSEISD